MELLSNPPLIPADSSNHKKLYIIVGVIVFAIVVCVPILLGILSSTPSGKLPTTANGKTQNQTGTSPQPSQIIPSIAITATIDPLAPSPNQYEKQYAATPIPTVNLDSLLPTVPVTPTPTPLPGPFYVANGKQNDLTIRLYTPDTSNQTYEVQLINAKTHEVRIMGYTYLFSSGDSAFFTANYSQVLFLGGKKNNLQNISFYSIPSQTVVKTITFGDITQELPNFPVQITAVLSNMLLSPDGKRVALSYGNTFSENLIDPNTIIFVINLGTKKMEILPAKGLTKDWKDNNTLEYQAPTNDPKTNAVQSVSVPAI